MEKALGPVSTLELRMDNQEDVPSGCIIQEEIYWSADYMASEDKFMPLLADPDLDYN